MDDVGRSESNLKNHSGNGFFTAWNSIAFFVPKAWPVIVIDLKNCFFTIPLHEQDKEKYASTMSTYNNSKPVKRYHWRVLPQGILSSPTFCQYFVQLPLKIIHK